MRAQNDSLPSAFHWLGGIGHFHQWPDQHGLVTHLSLDGDATATLAGMGGTVNGNVQFAAGKFELAATVDQYGDGFIRLNDDLGVAQRWNGNLRRHFG